MKAIVKVATVVAPISCKFGVMAPVSCGAGVALTAYNVAKSC